jgi:mannose-6-phosphate isomerase-like protein (cupin superfamily)
MEDVRTIHEPILCFSRCGSRLSDGLDPHGFQSRHRGDRRSLLRMVARTAHPWTARAPPPEDHVFYVIAGTLSISFNEEPRDAAKGAYVVIP